VVEYSADRFIDAVIYTVLISVPLNVHFRLDVPKYEAVMAQCPFHCPTTLRI